MIKPLFNINDRHVSRPRLLRSVIFYDYPGVWKLIHCQLPACMGASQSTSEAHSPSQALHVLRVTPSSPASQTNIEPFFDFIVGFEGDSLSSHSNIDVNELETIVEAHEGRVLNLLVWSSKNQDTRGASFDVTARRLYLLIILCSGSDHSISAMVPIIA